MINIEYRTVRALLGATLLAVAAAPALAQPTPATLGCASAKQKDLGKHAAAYLGCQSKTAKAGGTLGDAAEVLCTDKAELKFQAAHQKAEDKAVALGSACADEAETLLFNGGGINYCLDDITAAACAGGTCHCARGNVDQLCLTSLDCGDWNGDATPNTTDDHEAALLALVNNPITLQGLADVLGPQLYPVVGVNGCAAAKLKEAGKAASGLLGCYSKASKKGTPVDQVKCINKVESKLLLAFDKAETKPPCLTIGDKNSVLQTIRAFVELAVIRTPRNNGCGSGFVTGSETCDDGNVVNTDNCPSDCTAALCTPIGATDRPFTVSFASSKNISVVRVFVDYPEDRVAVPGAGGSIPSGEIDGVLGDPFTIFEFNDVGQPEHGLLGVLIDASGPPASGYGLSGDLFTVHFDDCTGAVPPVAGDFTCTVIDAADPAGKAVTGATCSVN